MKQIIYTLLTSALTKISQIQNLSIDLSKIEASIERTKNVEHGDFASNISMVLAKSLSTNPRALAQGIIDNLPNHPLLEKVEIAGPGFMNFTLKKSAYHQEIQLILQQNSAYGKSTYGQNEKVQIEFVSANPTGPLHVGHGRGAAIGDSLARLLACAGFNTHKEFYYNDAGVQIANLALSVQARLKGLTPESPDWPKDSYHGDYIQDIADAFAQKKMMKADDREVCANGDINDLENIREFAVAYLRHEQDLDLKAFEVNFDEYYLESDLYKNGDVEKVVNLMTQNGYTFEQDGALWLKSTAFGDDKDRVMRKSEGGYTYFVPDVAYHLNKWQRGFTKVINEHGADHHGTLSRVKAGIQALNMDIPKDWPSYVLHQMVLVMRNGEEVKLSKRAGNYVTLRDLIDEVGKDATRFFLVARKNDSQLHFDIDLARSQTNDNPVYYIQYAHARICNVLKDNPITDSSLDTLSLLTESHEIDLMRILSRYPEMIVLASCHYAPHLIAAYLQDLAACIHAYYNAHKFLLEDKALQNARLTLISAAKIVLANGLDILGVSAPNRM